MPEQTLLAKARPPHPGPAGRPGAPRKEAAGPSSAGRNRRVLLRTARTAGPGRSPAGPGGVAVDRRGRHPAAVHPPAPGAVLRAEATWPPPESSSSTSSPACGASCRASPWARAPACSWASWSACRR
ncbi:hypothetical protein ACR6C2_43765 [Streptomyces sp. INA 01156]